MKTKKIAIASIFSSIIVLVIGLGLLWPVSDPLFDDPYSRILLSREGDLLSARISEEGQWRFQEAGDLPEKYIKTLLTFEDRQFYKHPGLNPFSIARAVYQNYESGKIVSGGSTITMQLARMARGNQTRNIYQKLVEIWLAFRIELKYSKGEILDLYAANAPFGGNVIGFEAASWRYYGRSPHQLSWAEVANLTVLPNAPGLIFPGSNENQYLLKRNHLLEEMYKMGQLSRLDLELAIGEPLPGKPLPLPDMSRHLLDRLASDNPDVNRLKSTINYDLQSFVKQVVNSYSLKFKYKQIHNAAAMVVDIESGEVLAYVGNTGSRNEGNHGQDVDIITSLRSPGSLLKPVLYALALDEGLITPNQLLPDIPMYYQGFTPQNFDKKFNGAVHADQALSRSLNVPFVYLLKDYGYEKMHQKLGKVGIRSLDKPAGHYGLTMILGGGEVTLSEITGLYAGMARSLFRYNASKGNFRYNDLDYHPNFLLLEESDNTEGSDSDYGIISAGPLYHMFDVMQGLRRPESSINWKRYQSSRSIAWKTGTSYGHKDAWAVGLNSNYVVGVWLGNADGEGRPDLTGINAAAPLMFRLFELLDGDTDFKKPIADMDFMNICRLTGFRAGFNCPDINKQIIAKSSKSAPICSYHKQLNLDKEMKWRVNSSCYPVKDIKSVSWFVLPPSQALYYRKVNSDYQDPPEILSSCKTENNNFMEMIYPRRFTKVYVPVEIDGNPGRVVFEAAHSNPTSNVYWHLNNKYIGVTRSTHQLGLYPEKGKHKLSLVDDQGRMLTVDFQVLNEDQDIKILK